MNLKLIKNKTQLNRALKRVDELWGAKRNLTLPMIKRLHEGLNIPYNRLIS